MTTTAEEILHVKDSQIILSISPKWYDDEDAVRSDGNVIAGIPLEADSINIAFFAAHCKRRRRR